MNGSVSYTTEEIAKMLKISKLTVYDLIRKGELPAYRVGRQMRVDAADLEAYKARAKGRQQEPVSLGFGPAAKPGAEGSGVRRIVITGQDVSLDILARHVEKRTKRFWPLRSYVGSMSSLIAMYRGEADIVSTHLWDGDTGEYNVPYVQKVLVGYPYIVLNLLCRTAGLYVQQGNPKTIRSWADFRRKDIAMVNREKGSGARVLLDEQLRLHGIAGREVAGYDREETSHLAVAGKVAGGEADVGVGIEKAAYVVGVDFIPLVKERYDLVMLKSPDNAGMIEMIADIVRSDDFKKELQSIRGYDLSLTGQVMFETW